MVIFECYFFIEFYMYVEKSNFYYYLWDEEWFSEKILVEFDVKEEGLVIINGYILVKVKKGELLIKVNGKVFVIDGGLFKVY